MDAENRDDVRTESDKAGPGAERHTLDQLGDLFFSSRNDSRSAGEEPQSPVSSGISDLLAKAPAPTEEDCPKRCDPTARSPVPVTAILAGGLPPERRAALARRAAMRLAPPNGRTVLLTFADQRVTAQTIDRTDSTGGRPAAGRRLDDLLGSADQAMIILTDGAASHLDAGRQLPDHCVVLVTPDSESLVEGYRELKTATAVTTGPVPDLFVLEADSRTLAERTYRRLARVAISHLGCTPTFAGQLIGPTGTEPLPEEATPLVLDCLDAETAWRDIRPLLGRPDQDRSPTAEPAQLPPRLVVQPHEPQAGQRQTLPPVAGVVNIESPRPLGGVFTTWTPQSRGELLEAVNGSMTSLVPNPRGVVDLDGEVAAPECPDLVAVDQDGRPVAVLVSDNGDPSVLRRAIESPRWLSSYARLLSRAFPDAGFDPSAQFGGCLVVVPEDQVAAIAGLCPPGVQAAGYLPVACGSVRGLLLRKVSGAEAPAADRQPSAGSAGQPTWHISPATVAESAFRESKDGQSANGKTATGPAEAVAGDEPPLGTSPDDDLSADELSDLRTSFEIDELT